MVETATDRAGLASSAWTYEEGDSGNITDDAEAMAADLELQFSDLGFWVGTPVIASYKAAATHADGTCPPQGTLYTDDDGQNTWWYGFCMTSQGVHFNGAFTEWDWDGQGVEATDVVDVSGRLPEGFSYWGGGFEGRVDIFDEAGTYDFSCSCSGTTGHGVNGDETLEFSVARGPASWTGTEASGSWLEVPETRPHVFQSYRHNLAGELSVHIELQMSGLGVRYSDSVLNADVTFMPSETGEKTCSYAVVKGSVRDLESSLWQDIEGAPGSYGSCESCFNLTNGDEVCLDLSAVADVDTSAW